MRATAIHPSPEVDGPVRAASSPTMSVIVEMTAGALAAGAWGPGLVVLALMAPLPLLEELADRGPAGGAR